MSLKLSKDPIEETITEIRNLENKLNLNEINYEKYQNMVKLHFDILEKRGLEIETELNLLEILEKDKIKSNFTYLAFKWKQTTKLYSNSTMIQNSQ